MSRQFRAELLKIRSTRTTVGLVLGMVALVLLFSLLSGLLTKAPQLVTTEDQRSLLSVGSFAGVFSALAGIMLVTSEYRYGTIRPTFLVTPRRPRVRAAKLAAGAFAGGIGVALGTVVRNQVGAIIGLLAWGFLAENLVFGLVPDAGRLGPVHAQDALIGLATDHLLHAPAGRLVLVAWAAVLSLAGTALIVRRDVD